MLGTTLTLNLNGTGGTPVVLNRISDDGLSARYFKQDTTSEYQLDVSHVIDKNGVAKHYLEFKWVNYADATRPARTMSVALNFKAINSLVEKANQKAIVTALTDFVGATTATAGMVDQLIGLNS